MNIESFKELLYKETKRSFKKKAFNADNWKYDAEQWGLLMLGYDFKQLARLMKA